MTGFFLDNCVNHILSINRSTIDVQSGNFSSWWNNKENQNAYEVAKNSKLKKEVTRLSSSAKKNAGWSNKIEKSKKGSTNSGSKVDTGFIGHKSAKMMKRSKVIVSRQQKAIEEKSTLLKDIETTENLKIHPANYHSDVLLNLSNVTIYYNKKAINSPITSQINKGDRIALHGKNGSGKSSLLKLILGHDINFTGCANVGSQLVISYVSQDATHLNGLLSEYAKEYEIDESLFKSILRKLGFQRIQFEKDISEFSGGQKKKVLIARSLCESAHLYVWDEPLNYIDIYSRMQIEQLIIEYSPTIIFVEHDKSFRETIATKAIDIIIPPPRHN